jgi:hypothetical protein
VVLVLLAPFAFVIRWWRRWRRGGDTRCAVDSQAVAAATDRARRRFDLTLDHPEPVPRDVHRRTTAVVVRIADVLRRPGDTYHAVYRLPTDPEPYLVPVGPQLQELGERFLLTLSQGALAGRTVVWMTLDSAVAPAEVADPTTCNPENRNETDALLMSPAVRWSMASSWARVGPSWVLRLILVVPEPSAEGVEALLARLR